MSDADQATKLADASLKAAESKLSKLNPTGFGGLKAMEALPAFLDKTKDIESARRDATSAVASLEREYNVIKTVGDHAWANSDKSKQNPEQTRADVQAALQENALKRSAYIQRIQGMDNKLDNLRTAMGLPRMRDLVNGMHGILQSATHNAMIDPKSQGMARDNIRQAAERFSHQTGGRSIWQYLPKPTWAE
jgi:hypothetical protein